MGVWIEIVFINNVSSCAYVTPLVGVWIEMDLKKRKEKLIIVTPLVGVWIEIKIDKSGTGSHWSLPLWECGLKFIVIYGISTDCRHSPCGSVD